MIGNIKRNILIVCPANFASGGPLLLHQLAQKLIQKGVDAQMFYLDAKENTSPVHEFYNGMNIPFTTKADDNSNNIFIIPETLTSLLFEYPNSGKVIWWLSVDNFLNKVKAENQNPINLIIQTERYSLNLFNKIKFNLFLTFLFLKSFKKKYKNRLLLFKRLPELSRKIKTGEFAMPYHWVQSHYAKNYLERIGINNSVFLSDYLDPVFIREAKKISFKNEFKKDIIVYNPKKGFEITQKLIAKSENIKWVAIENMTPEQVKNLLVESKLYIDFGNHPGKDRIPREAAICGCIVITNKDGSASFYKDVPIPDQYKIEHSPQTESKTIDFFSLCFTEYEQRIIDFDSYRKSIEKEEQVFSEDLANVIRLNLS